MKFLSSLLFATALGLVAGQADIMKIFEPGNIEKMIKQGMDIPKLAKSLKIPGADQIEGMMKSMNVDKIAQMFQNQDLAKMFTPENLQNVMKNGFNIGEMAKQFKIPGAEQVDNLMKSFETFTNPEKLGKFVESLKAKLDQRKAAKSSKPA